MIVISFLKGFYLERSKINPSIRVYCKQECMFSITLEVPHHLSLGTLFKLDFKHWSNFFLPNVGQRNCHDVVPVTFIHGNASCNVDVK